MTTIKRKTANCIECNQLRLVYALKRCQQCYWKSKLKSWKKKPLKAPIRKKSKKLTQQEREYRIVKARFLSENPVCMYPGCNSMEVTLHHAKGRIGTLLTDRRYFKSLCWPHHQHIEQNPVLARKLGLSYSRLSNI
ncbi:hypothetical protein SAMN05421877_11925 [Sphingobacterium lactis]|uniref:Uncharacterized protein n=1 Tax=Sphingobacterium lactis TaxID=797291 RepID=A0A1H6CSY3_9SPHI|nr:hypothetical protein SAMN05421877_11925 [Sphingobacterium lactis]